jgi:beta-glucosidase
MSLDTDNYDFTGNRPETEFNKELKEHNIPVISRFLEDLYLKNNDKVLPLSSKIGAIALIGTDATEARLGGYSGPGSGKISILDGLKKRLGSSVQINYAPGCGRSTDEWKIIPANALSTVRNGKVEQGLLGEYFNNITLTGKPTITRTDANLNFHWTLFSPDEAINLDFYSARWTGNFTAPASGKYKIGRKKTL